MKLLEQHERSVLTYLRKNARMRLTKLSRLTRIPVSTLHDKIRRDYKDVIEKYTVLVRFNKLGYAARACVILKVQRDQKITLKRYLLKHKHVNSLYKINNGYDFMMEVIYPTMQQFEQFLEKLEEQFSFHELRIYYLLHDLKREAFLSDPIQIKLEEPVPEIARRNLYKEQVIRMHHEVQPSSNPEQQKQNTNITKINADQTTNQR